MTAWSVSLSQQAKEQSNKRREVPTMTELETLWQAFESCTDEAERGRLEEMIAVTQEYYDDYSQDSGVWEP